ncbi:MAG: alkaline phosphatase [Deltaproteobacteria bacterium]|nr:alkaline phosphatase [Deltaproteobacteria bacterium]
MKKITTIVIFIFSAAVLTACSFLGKNVHDFQKNIIFMVPDGMGLSNTTAARIFKNGPNGARLNFETLDNIGYQSTHSKNSTVTDSAAAASAWAVGEKFNNGEISCHDDDSDGTCDGEPALTILDIAKSKGMATGLVATSDITHATPAAFGATVHNRKCEEEIARQFLARDIDVLLGGGIAGNRSSCKLSPSEGDWLNSLLTEYTHAGYAVVNTKADMEAAVNGGKERLLGLFKSGGKTQELFRVGLGAELEYPEPTLAEMTAAALDILEKNRDGLFLMVEGSQIDWENHDNDVNGQIAETLGFDAAVKVVLDWVNANPVRKMSTQVIVVADHDCGGMGINGPGSSLSEAGDIVQVDWTSDGHTGVDTIVYSQGPLTWKLNKAVDNTFLNDVMEEFLKR